MYKIFKITYNDGGWYCGGLPHFYYIAKNEKDVIDNSKEYQEYIEMKKNRGGDIWISEITNVVGIKGLVSEIKFENYKAFDIEITIKQKE